MFVSVFDWPAISLFLGGIAPLIAFALAANLELRRRRNQEKPPQVEKLLRPPGYSLSVRLDELTERVVTEFGGASALSACAGVGTAMTARFFAFGVPILWIVGSVLF